MPTYFTSHRSLAVGLAATGSATGGLVFPAIMQKLLPVIGFPWTMRVLRFLTSGMLLLSFFRLEQRVPPRKSGPIVECRAFLEPAYLLFSIGIFLNFRGLYIAFFYISSFAKQHIGFTEDKSIDLILIMNGVGVLARIHSSKSSGRPLHRPSESSDLIDSIIECNAMVLD